MANTGRMNLAEELGRIDAEKMNRNRRAEKDRVIHELNAGYKSGGSVKSRGVAKRGFGKEVR
tara:strand:+ start:221 stop:406 length:186 start_codon:yes stop_codon:yes gene_type:complete